MGELAAAVLGHILVPFTLEPDLAALEASSSGLVPVAGIDFRAQLPYRATAALATRLGLPPERVPTKSPSPAVFEPPMRENFDEEMGLRADLARALDEDALQVVYQPIVDLTDGRLAGVEALVRWQHWSIGDVPPAIFIPIAERAGLIDRIGSFVLSRACAQFAQWSQASTAYLSVNVSPLQLLDPDFPRQVHDDLVRHGIRPGQLVLELTENALADESAMIEALRRLRCTGVRIAIDDFGTGYSSLRYLSRLPIDIVKIDRSYVRAVASDEGAARLVGTLTQLFSGLGLTAIAEGIEEPEQVQTLLGLGCLYGQGYLFSRPVAADQLPAADREMVPAPSSRPA